MKTFCFTLDLRDDPGLIREYIQMHREVWPEVISEIRQSGILSMEIYHFGRRLFMYMQTTDDFSLDRKQEQDRNNPRVQEWEELMWTYQAKVEGSQPREKWVLMEKIFDLQKV